MGGRRKRTQESLPWEMLSAQASSHSWPLASPLCLQAELCPVTSYRDQKQQGKTCGGKEERLRLLSLDH